ncbi:transcription termination factor 4, mitochondrial isoform X2 [Bacillus rossius redtenbacheri]|uniref:transcription termination factor 4, mitochondrial isoform X2 n=1 Tax=Bacillus rossius redtenbacheri TaxID=93214 RepID=UPI002FDD4D97
MNRINSRSMWRHCGRSVLRLRPCPRHVATDAGLAPDSVLKAAERSPVLAQAPPEQLRGFFSCMAENGVSCKDGLALLAANPSFLTVSPSQFSRSIEQWRQCQLGEDNFRRLLVCHVDFLLIPTKQIARRIPFFKDLCGSRKNLCNLLQNCPGVMTENWSALQNKIVYMLTEMKMENVKIAKSMALNQSLNTIRTRHVFLERCGRFTAPNPKVDPSVATNNPSLSNITDTSDKDFAEKVAGVSLEEYEVFCELFAEEVEVESNFDSDSDDEEQ